MNQKMKKMNEMNQDESKDGISRDESKDESR